MINLPPQANPPAKAEPLSDENLQKMAYELARNLYPPETVYEQFGITPEIFQEFVVDNPSFQAYYAESFLIWNGSASIKDRLKAKTAVAFEEFLPIAMGILADPNAGAAPKVQLGVLLAKVAGIHDDPKAVTSQGNASSPTNPQGNSVHVTINLGHGRQIVIDKKLDAQDVEAEIVEPPAQASVPNLNGGQIPPYVVEQSSPHEGPKPQGELHFLGARAVVTSNG